MKLNLFIGAFCLFFLASAARSQEEFIEPPSTLLTKLEFTQATGGVVVFKALLNNFPDTLNFILDSGSSGISLDSATVNHFRLVPEESDKTIRGIAGIRKVSFLHDQKLKLANLVVDSLDFHVNDYEVLSSVYGMKIDGIAGYSLLNRYIIKLNYDTNQMQIWSNGSMKYPKGGSIFRPLIRSLPVQTARAGDENIVTARFLHDIGAGVSLMLSQDFLEDSLRLNKKRKMWPKTGEGIGGKIDMQLTVLKELRIGNYRFRNVPTLIFDDVYNVTSYPYLGGLIGNDIYRRFNMIYNYAKREIHATPNSHFREPFDYSYSGIELYYVDDKIELGIVPKGSPAEIAGLLERDVVIAVNNNFSGNFNQYKTALQAINQKLKIIVQRDGELMQFEVKTKSIL